MFSYCTDYAATMPDVTIYINCDTILAVNLGMFDIGDNDEFIFVIKNYDYIDSPHVFLFKARKADIDKNGEVIFKITPEVSKQIKPSAFYNFSVMVNAFDTKATAIYKKLTDNGRVLVAYGAQDMLVKPNAEEAGYEVVSVRIEPVDDSSTSEPNKYLSSKIIGVRFEEVL